MSPRRERRLANSLVIARDASRSCSLRSQAARASASPFGSATCWRSRRGERSGLVDRSYGARLDAGAVERRCWLVGARRDSLEWIATPSHVVAVRCRVGAGFSAAHRWRRSHACSVDHCPGISRVLRGLLRGGGGIRLRIPPAARPPALRAVRPRALFIMGLAIRAMFLGS